MCLTSCSPLTFHFLPASQKRETGKGGVSQTEGVERERREEKGKIGGRRAPPLSLSISPLSLSHSFSPSVSQRENLVASPLPRQTSSQSTLPATGDPPLSFSFLSFFALGAFEPRSAKVSLSSVAAALNERTGKFSKDLGKKKHHLTQKDAKKWNEIAKTQVSPAFFLSIRRTSKETKGCILRRFRGTCWVGRILADHKYYLIRSVPGRLTALALAAVFNHKYLKL